MNTKQKRMLTVLVLMTSVLAVVIFVSIRPFTLVPNGGGNGTPTIPDPPLPVVITISSTPVLQTISPAIDPDGTISLVWSIISEAEAYQVYMSKNNGEWQLIKITGVFAYVKSGLTNGNYRFKVRGYNSEGYTPMSNVRSVVVSIPLPDPIPDAPDLSLKINSPSTDGEIKLEWNSVSGATMYTLFYFKDGGSLDILKQDFSENYYDYSVLEDGVYFYKVKAGNSEGYSDYSNEVSVTVQLAGVPDVPVMNQITHEIIDDTIIIYLDWEEVDCDNYNVYRSIDYGDYEPIVDGLTLTSYSETLIESGVYKYKVSAVNEHGESELSVFVTIEITEDGEPVEPVDYTMTYILLVVLGVLIIPVAIILVKRKKRRS